MGLKSGSRDAELDGDTDERGAEQNEARKSATRDAIVETEPMESTHEEPTDVTETGTDTDRPTMQSIPYVLRREKVNEGRDQVPYFIRDEVLAGEDDLQDELESILDERVYKSDYREAAMVLAQRRPELVADILREWGYDLDSE